MGPKRSLQQVVLHCVCRLGVAEQVKGVVRLQHHRVFQCRQALWVPVEAMYDRSAAVSRCWLKRRGDGQSELRVRFGELEPAFGIRVHRVEVLNEQLDTFGNGETAVCQTSPS